MKYYCNRQLFFYVVKTLKEDTKNSHYYDVEHEKSNYYDVYVKLLNINIQMLLSIKFHFMSPFYNEVDDLMCFLTKQKVCGI